MKEMLKVKPIRFWLRLTLIFTMLVSAFCLYAAEMVPSVLGSSDVEHLMQGWQGQVDLLKWIGGVMVLGLSSSVAFLIRALLTSNTVIVNEVKEAGRNRVDDATARQEMHEDLMVHMRELSEARKKTEEQIAVLTVAIQTFRCELPCAAEGRKVRRENLGEH